MSTNADNKHREEGEEFRPWTTRFLDFNRNIDWNAPRKEAEPDKDGDPSWLETFAIPLRSVASTTGFTDAQMRTQLSTSNGTNTHNTSNSSSTTPPSELYRHPQKRSVDSQASPVVDASTNRSGVRLSGLEDTSFVDQPPRPQGSSSNVDSVLGTPLSPPIAGSDWQRSKNRSGNRSGGPDEVPGAFRIPGIQHDTGNNQNEYDNLTTATDNRTINSSLTYGTPNSLRTSQYGTAPELRDSVTQHTSLTEATPVIRDVEDSERHKIREEAEAVVHNKLAATVTVAKTQEEHEANAKAEQLDSNRRRNRRRCILIVLLALFLSGIIAVVIGVVVGRKNNKAAANSLAEEGAPTSPPTTDAPTPLPFFDADPYQTDTCYGAYDLSNRLSNPGQQGRPFVVNGTTAEASSDDFLSPCGIVESNGRGVWYRMSGNAISTSVSLTIEGLATQYNRWLASTCHDLTQYDSQLSIYRGTCDEGSPPLLQCVAGNDQTGTGCRDSSRVAFVVEPTADYFVFVHGFRNTGGLFQLSIGPLPDNDQCDGAVFIEQPSSQDEIVAVFGSTRGATAETSVPATCGGTTISSAGVWYTFEGTGDIRAIVLEAKDTTGFVGQMTVYRGSSCSELTCVTGSSSGSIEYYWTLGQTFYVLVHGSDNHQGDFSIVIDPAYILPGIPGPPECDFAPFLDVGSTERDDLASYTTLMPAACGNGVFINGPGVYFRVTGTGGVLRASTCNNFTAEAGTDTRISVFRGNGCDNLLCIGGSNDGIGCPGTSDGSSSFLWPSEIGRRYYVLVHGISNRVGQFELSIEEVEVKSADTCADASPISQNGPTIIGTLSHAIANNKTTVPRCPGFNEWPGVWYSVQGTGKQISASICDEELDAHISLAVYRGDCVSLQCVDSVVTPCGRQSSVAWNSELDETYLILVQAPIGSRNESPGGRLLAQFGNEPVQAPSLEESALNGFFRLTVQSAVFNDQCSSPIGPVPVEGSLTYGSTLGATVDETKHCFVDPSEAIGRGVWYTAIGNGERLTAATATGFTTFATLVSVFTGSCSDLSCVPDLELIVDEEGRSTVMWDSMEGQLYSILLSGSEIDELGEFALRISVNNDICAASQTISIGETVRSAENVDDFATADQMLPNCQPFVDVWLEWQTVELSRVWYTIEPASDDNELVAVVTHPERDGAAVLTVYSGSCTALECVEAVASETGRYGSYVRWEAREDTRYFVLVHGPVLGPYELSVALYGQSCVGATEVVRPFDEVLVRPAGYSSSSISQCNVPDPVQGHWFHIKGTGIAVDVDLSCGSKNSIEAYRVSLLQGGCGSELTCISTTTTNDCYEYGLMTIQTLIGVDYYLVVSPLSAVSFGHGVFVGFYERGNLQCDDSQTLDGVLEDGFMKEDFIPSIFGQSQPTFCGTAANVGGTGAFSGAWFKFRGTGGLLSAATCYDGTDVDSQITVYKGTSCDALQCVTGANDLALDVQFALGGQTISTVEHQFASYTDVCESVVDELPRTSSVSWVSRTDETYYVLVHGVQGDFGNFTLTIQEDPLEVYTDCISAIDLTPAMLVAQSGTTTGSTRFALHDGSPVCAQNATTNRAGRAVWYKFQGTGNRMSFSACSEQTEFVAVMDVYTGQCGQLRCVLGHRSHSCAGPLFGTSITVDTILGVAYSVRVSGDAMDRYGDFLLQFRVGSGE